MGMFGRVLFWACAAIAVFIGSGMLFHSDPQVQTGGLVIVVGVVVVGLALRWLFSGGED